MSRIWEALQKVEGGVLRDWAQADRRIIPEPVVSRIAPVPNSVGVDKRGIGDPIRIMNEKPVGYSCSEPVQAENPESVLVYAAAGSQAADRYRLLRMRLRNLSAAAKLQSILVTSALPEDGKTTVCLNLATVLADQNKNRVLLIDADLHRGCVAEQLGISVEAGLKECLQEGLDPLAAIRRVEPFGWHLLQSGALQIPHPTELLRPQEFSELLRRVAAHFDWIVVDSPPVLALSDAVGLSQAVDGTLMVARADRTPTKAVEDAIAVLGRRHLVGLVLNAVSSSAATYSAYNKYYPKSSAAE